MMWRTPDTNALQHHLEALLSLMIVRRIESLMSIKQRRKMSKIV